MAQTPAPADIVFEPISEEEKEARKKLWTGPQTLMVNMITAKPSKAFFTEKYKSMAESIWNFECREDDVWMVTYPKAGSTVMQELVWQVVHGFDVEGGKENIFTRAPFFEMSALCGEVGCTPALESKDPKDQMNLLMADSVGFTARMKSPRVIKTHLPLAFLPKQVLEKSKIIWINRGCKDSMNSWFNHEQILPVHGYTGGFEDLAELYLQGKILYGDYWETMKDGYSVKDRENVLHFWYEEFRADSKDIIKRIANFLKLDFPQEKVDLLADHLHIDNFRNNDACNMKPPKGAVPDEVRDKINFIRKGAVNGWKTENFNPELIAKFDKWIADNNAVLKTPYN